VSAAAADFVGLILAGGRATRLGGGDKSLREIGGRPMLAHVFERLAPQVGPVAISANDDPARFAEYGLPVLADESAPAGPLSGVLSGMVWAKEEGSARLLTVAGDTPFFPRDLAARLGEATAGRDDAVAVAVSSGRRHHVFALWPVTLEAELRDFLAKGASFSVAAFLERRETAEVEFPAARFGNRTIDPFFNVNTPEDLAKAEAIAKDANP
jgi:molybdopterin-guanine dinucleotide biosynthesis protein A